MTAFWDFGAEDTQKGQKLIFTLETSSPKFRAIVSLIWLEFSPSRDIDKEDMQKLLLNIIDAFATSKKQVIITSEFAPKCFSVIEAYDRGMIADIDAPKNIRYETAPRPLVICKSCDMMKSKRGSILFVFVLLKIDITLVDVQ